MKKGDRKARIEVTVRNMAFLDGPQSKAAWRRLVHNLTAMTEPEARPPRFNGLLRAIWAAATNEQS